MKKVLFLANNDAGLYNFRRELIEELNKLNCEIYISLPKGRYIDALKSQGCNFIETNISRHSINRFTDFILFVKYCAILKKLKPDIVLTYTIKPNVYGGLACQVYKIPYLVNVTGLGTSIQNGGPLQKISLMLYKLGLKKAKRVFFQNSENHRIMTENGIVTSSTTILPGSGVNLEHFKYVEYPSEKNGVHFLFVGRIMKDKGIDELLDAARKIKDNYSNVFFDIVGRYDGPYENVINKAVDEGIIQYYGQQEDVRPFYQTCHCIVLPSYHEGMSNVLLEGAAIGRPLITTNIPGCRETVKNGVNGFLCEPKKSDSLYENIFKMIRRNNEARKNMGVESRKLVEERFDRQIIISNYLKEI